MAEYSPHEPRCILCLNGALYCNIPDIWQSLVRLALPNGRFTRGHGDRSEGKMALQLFEEEDNVTHWPCLQRSQGMASLGQVWDSDRRPNTIFRGTVLHRQHNQPSALAKIRTRLLDDYRDDDTFCRSATVHD